MEEQRDYSWGIIHRQPCTSLAFITRFASGRYDWIDSQQPTNIML